MDEIWAISPMLSYSIRLRCRTFSVKSNSILENLDLIMDFVSFLCKICSFTCEIKTLPEGGTKKADMYLILPDCDCNVIMQKS